MFNHKRSDVEVAADILRIKGSQTAIMYGANLSYSQTHKYIQQLTDMALLQPVIGKNGRRKFHTTQRGQDFLDLVEKMEVLLQNPAP